MSETKVAIFNGINTTSPLSGVTEIDLDITTYAGSVSPGDAMVALIDLATLGFPTAPPGFTVISPNRLSQPLGVDLSANRYLAIFTSP